MRALLVLLAAVVGAAVAHPKPGISSVLAPNTGLGLDGGWHQLTGSQAELLQTRQAGDGKFEVQLDLAVSDNPTEPQMQNLTDTLSALFGVDKSLIEVTAKPMAAPAEPGRDTLRMKNAANLVQQAPTTLSISIFVDDEAAADQLADGLRSGASELLSKAFGDEIKLTATGSPKVVPPLDAKEAAKQAKVDEKEVVKQAKVDDADAGVEQQTTFECGEAFVCEGGDTPMVPKPADTMCAEEACTVEECCQPKMPCEQMDCGIGFKNKDSGFCASAACVTPTDLEACCEKVDAVCGDAFVCDGGDTPMVSKPADTTCAGDACTAEECCQIKMPCEQMDCGVGYTNKGYGFCTSAACVTPTDLEVCCDKLDHKCGEKFEGSCSRNQVVVPADTVCVDCTREECCKDKGKCTDLDCGEGFVSDKEKYCMSAACVNDDQVDRQQCCQTAAKCEDYPELCPDNMVHKGGPSFCDGTICTEQDIGLCCFDKMSCSKLTCPNGMAHKEGDLFCASAACIQDYDMPAPSDIHTCCEGKQFCNEPDGFTFRCPASMLPAEGDPTCSDASCDASSTVDQNLCCKPKASCETAACGDDMVAEPGTFCSHTGDTCLEEGDKEECCKPREPCVATTTAKTKSTVNLAQQDAETIAGFVCPPSHIEKVPAPETPWLCAGTKCDPSVDLDSCCAPKAPCSSIAGVVNNAGMTGCPAASFVLGGFCAGTACGIADMDICCREQSVCTAAVCPTEKALKFDESGNPMLCSTDTCTEPVDEGICCQPRDTCASMVPDKPAGCDAVRGFSSPDATGNPEDLCLENPIGCPLSETRGDPRGKTLLKEGAEGILCAGATCDPAVDGGTCCNEPPLCSEFDCNTYISGQVPCEHPATTIGDNDAVCCRGAPTCGSAYDKDPPLECPPELGRVHRDISCLGFPCTVTDCCKGNPTETGSDTSAASARTLNSAAGSRTLAGASAADNAAQAHTLATAAGNAAQTRTLVQAEEPEQAQTEEPEKAELIQAPGSSTVGR